MLMLSTEPVIYPFPCNSGRRPKIYSVQTSLDLNVVVSPNLFLMKKEPLSTGRICSGYWAHPLNGLSSKIHKSVRHYPLTFIIRSAGTSRIILLNLRKQNGRHLFSYSFFQPSL